MSCCGNEAMSPGFHGSRQLEKIVSRLLIIHLLYAGTIVFAGAIRQSLSSPRSAAEGTPAVGASTIAAVSGMRETAIPQSICGVNPRSSYSKGGNQAITVCRLSTVDNCFGPPDAMVFAVPSVL